MVVIMVSEEATEMVLKVTDLKQYVYCPRILYFTYVLPVPHPVTRKMDFGKIEHLKLDRLERRRKLKRYGLEQGERIFHTQFYSKRLGLQGKLDLHIQYEKENYPVEFKHSSKLQFNHKVQLAGYALLLEEKLGRPVRTGFLYLIPKEEIIPVQMTQDLRDYIHDTLKDIRRVVTKARWPKATTQRHRCRECEYRRYCQDIVY